MKILHILNHSFPLLDGYASRSQNIIKAQKKMGWTPVILTSSKHEEDLKKDCPKKESIDNFDFYRTGKNPFENLPMLADVIQMFMVFFRLLGVINKEKPQLIHSHSPILNCIPALAAARLKGLPVVYEIRAFWEDAGVDQSTYREKSFKYNLVKNLETWVCKRVDQVAVLCRGIENDLISRGIPQGKITPVFNGLNPENFKPCSPDIGFMEKWDLNDKKIIGFIGSFYRYEGLDLLVEAFSKIIHSRPDVRLLLVGGGEMETHLKQQAADLNITDQVIIPGRIPHEQVQGIYALMDILIYPRYSVRLTELVTPLKPLEAMAMGKAVVASDIGGHRELIINHETGLLFKAGDPAALADTINLLLNNDDKIAVLETSGPKYVAEKKTWQKTTAVYKEIYQRLSIGETI